jgi:hypothetical protein
VTVGIIRTHGYALCWGREEGSAKSRSKEELGNFVVVPASTYRAPEISLCVTAPKLTALEFLYPIAGEHSAGLGWQYQIQSWAERRWRRLFGNWLVMVQSTLCTLFSDLKQAVILVITAHPYLTTSSRNCNVIPPCWSFLPATWCLVCLRLFPER